MYPVSHNSTPLMRADQKEAAVASFVSTKEKLGMCEISTKTEVFRRVAAYICCCLYHDHGRAMSTVPLQ